MYHLLVDQTLQPVYFVAYCLS